MKRLRWLLAAACVAYLAVTFSWTGRTVTLLDLAAWWLFGLLLAGATGAAWGWTLDDEQ